MNKELSKQIEELERIANREVDLKMHPFNVNYQKGQEMIAKQALAVIKRLQKENEELKGNIRKLEIVATDRIESGPLIGKQYIIEKPCEMAFEKENNTINIEIDDNEK